MASIDYLLPWEWLTLHWVFTHWVILGCWHHKYYIAEFLNSDVFLWKVLIFLFQQARSLVRLISQTLSHLQWGAPKISVQFCFGLFPSCELSWSSLLIHNSGIWGSLSLALSLLEIFPYFSVTIDVPDSILWLFELERWWNLGHICGPSSGWSCKTVTNPILVLSFNFDSSKSACSF